MPVSAYTDKINGLCQSLRNVFESKDVLKYVNSILTTYVCQTPSDLESALLLISKVKGKSVYKFRLYSAHTYYLAIDSEAAEDAVKYIIFLADTNKLFDVALGIYDFELVLAVAQNSQKVFHTNMFP